MARTVSPSSREDSAAKSSSPSGKTRTRTTKSATPQPETTLAAELLTALSERLTAVEEKITTGFSALASAVAALQTALASQRPDGGDPAETILPVVADLIRRNLTEHLTPITAALKRLEERIGFVSNRLKHPPGGQERQKPWRHDQSPHPRSRRHNGPRPGQGQQWSPPSAASVQGHFAPRPLPGGAKPEPGEEEE